MQYSNSYRNVFVMARVCMREEIMSKYRLFSALKALAQPISLYQIEDTADLLTTYNELIDSGLFFRLKDFEN